MFIITL